MTITWTTDYLFLMDITDLRIYLVQWTTRSPYLHCPCRVDHRISGPTLSSGSPDLWIYIVQYNRISGPILFCRPLNTLSYTGSPDQPCPVDHDLLTYHIEWTIGYPDLLYRIDHRISRPTLSSEPTGSSDISCPLVDHWFSLPCPVYHLISVPTSSNGPLISEPTVSSWPLGYPDLSCQVDHRISEPIICPVDYRISRPALFSGPLDFLIEWTIKYPDLLYPVDHRISRPLVQETTGSPDLHCPLDPWSSLCSGP